VSECHSFNISGDIVNKKKVCVIPGGRKGSQSSTTHTTDHILCLALSSDGKYLVGTVGINPLV